MNEYSQTLLQKNVPLMRPGLLLVHPKPKQDSCHQKPQQAQFESKLKPTSRTKNQFKQQINALLSDQHCNDHAFQFQLDQLA